MTARLLVLFFIAFFVSQVGSAQQTDWLVNNKQYLASFSLSKENDDQFVLGNGLVERRFLIRADVAATISLENLTAKQSLIRAIKPEAKLTLNGQDYDVGGLVGQPNHAYVKEEWLSQMKPASGAFSFTGYKVGVPQQRFAWQRVRHHDSNSNWPPKGVRLSLRFEHSEITDVQIEIHYELYDGVPVFCKWLTIKNRGTDTVQVNRFTSEILAVVEKESRVESREGVELARPDSIHVETDFAFGGFNPENANRHAVHWTSDPEYSTQVNYKKQTPCLLTVQPLMGPEQTLHPGETFESFRTFELLYDSSERERRSLSLRKMYRVIAPWVTENPLMHHMRLSDPEKVIRAIDDAATVGFEMIILSFGSGFDIESEDEQYIQRWKEIANYAEEKGVELGGYSLLSSRRIGGGNDVVSPEGQKPTHGNCPALTSEWGQQYYRKLYSFFKETGFRVLEHDGPYPGDIDVTERLPLQKGEQDSRWVQAKIANDFYRWCRAEGIYVNAPDYYYLNGTNKCGMGYREVNWSLPREMQLIHTRQNIYDGTWNKTPSMGWMFVPLTEYHGGGADATIEPLHEHLDHYNQMILSNLGLGVQACFRGPRLFDTDETRLKLKATVDWFKKYRAILESDVVHGRRADGRNLDWMLHVNPQLENQGMLLVYNPTDQKKSEKLTLNLYYTGLSEQANVSEQGKKTNQYQLNRDYTIELNVTVEPNSMNWFVITD